MISKKQFQEEMINDIFFRKLFFKFNFPIEVGNNRQLIIGVDNERLFYNYSDEKQNINFKYFSSRGSVK
jgi:hypothetical protein